MTNLDGKSVSQDSVTKAVQQTYYVYLACLKNGALYVGSTKNVEKRIAAHNQGRGGRYTRINRPLTLVATWSFDSRALAMKAERWLKRLSPEQKLNLASQPKKPLETNSP